MKCEIPVITTNVTSLPEIAGDAALFVSPDSPGSIRDGMIRVVREEGLREELIKKGRERRELFSWDHTSGILWNSMKKVLDSHA
jgi:glycosyltransferase involved in cell wall biosynthesis